MMVLPSLPVRERGLLHRRDTERRVPTKLHPAFRLDADFIKYLGNHIINEKILDKNNFSAIIFSFVILNT